MSSLIVTIISILLVVLLSGIALWYSSSVSVTRQQQAVAVALSSQSAQISGAAQLYKVDTGEWPASILVLTADKKYLAYDPAPPVGLYAALTDLLATPAWADDTVTNEQLEAAMTGLAPRFPGMTRPVIQATMVQLAKLPVHARMLALEQLTTVAPVNSQAASKPSMLDWQWPVTDATAQYLLLPKLSAALCRVVNKAEPDTAIPTQPDMAKNMQCFGSAAPYSYLYMHPGSKPESVCLQLNLDTGAVCSGTTPPVPVPDYRFAFSGDGGSTGEIRWGGPIDGSGPMSVVKVTTITNTGAQPATLVINTVTGTFNHGTYAAVKTAESTCITGPLMANKYPGTVLQPGSSCNIAFDLVVSGYLTDNHDPDYGSPRTGYLVLSVNPLESPAYALPVIARASASMWIAGPGGGIISWLPAPEEGIRDIGGPDPVLYWAGSSVDIDLSIHTPCSGVLCTDPTQNWYAPALTGQISLYGLDLSLDQVATPGACQILQPLTGTCTGHTSMSVPSLSLASPDGSISGATARAYYVDGQVSTWYPVTLPSIRYLAPEHITLDMPNLVLPSVAVGSSSLSPAVGQPGAALVMATPTNRFAVRGWKLTGPDAADFALVPPTYSGCIGPVSGYPPKMTQIASGKAVCDVKVVFTPSSPGAKSATLSAYFLDYRYYNGTSGAVPVVRGTSPATFQLTGTGL